MWLFFFRSRPNDYFKLQIYTPFNRHSSYNWQLSTDGVINRVITLLIVEKRIGGGREREREREWGRGTIHALNQGMVLKLPLL